MSATPFIPCRVRKLPPPKLLEAARTALRHNPANGPRTAGVGLPPERIAALTSRYWQGGGVKLAVQFLDGPDAETRRLVLQYANNWGRTANVKFTETQGQGEVRIARTPGQGYYSYLGTDILHVPASECTMNLDSFTARTPLSEYSRVVQHEFGHTLGWPHEHMRREIVSRIDPQKAIAYFARMDGWDAETVRQQVLTPLDDADLTALPADTVSIMCYQLGGEITVDGQPIPGGTDIDPEDAALAAKLYPRAGTPTPTPTPTPQPPPSKLFPLKFRRDVPPGGRVVFFAPVRIPAGAYDVVPETPTGHEAVEAEYVPDPPEEV